VDDSFPPISDPLLRSTVGDGPFVRGKAYAQEGRVEILHADRHGAKGLVQGSERYRVEVAMRSGRLSGRCDCPAFDREGACKHMVAVAIAASSAGAVDRLAQLRTYLTTLGADALAERLLRIAAQDDAVLLALEREIAVASENDDAVAVRYRRLIDQVTDPREGVDYWGAASYAEEIESALEPLRSLAGAGRGALALALTAHLLDRIGEGIAATDDSEGEVFAVGERAAELHLELCRLVRPEPLALAADLFERELDGTTDLFGDADVVYVDVLGPQGVAEFRRLAHEAWRALPAPAKNEFGAARYVLKAILDRAAREIGDVDALIALRKGELTRPGAYVEIADICLEAGRDAEALRWLEEGLWCFEDEPDEVLQRRAAGLMATLGREEDALSILWRAFERRPGLGLFHELAALSKADPPGPRAMAFLRRAAESGDRLRTWAGPATVLLDLQMELGDFDGAWATVAEWKPDGYRLRALAERSRATHPALAAQAFERLAEESILLGGAANYDAAVRLIRLRGEACGDPADQGAYLAALRLRHKAKRTLMPRLDALD